MDTEDTYMYQRNPDDQGPTPRQRLYNQGDNDSGGNDPGKKKMSPSGLMFVIIALAVILGAGYLFLACQASTMNSQPIGELPYSSLYQQVMSGNVENAIFQGQDITGSFRKPIQLMDAGGNIVVADHFHVTQIPNGDPNLISLLNTYHVQYQAKPVADNPLLGVVVNFLPLIVVFGVVFFIARRASRGQQNVFSFGKSRANSQREDPFAGTPLATGSHEYSESTAGIIDEEVNRIVKWAYDRAVSLLTSHRETLDRFARSLRLYETLDAKQLHALMEETGKMRTGPL